MTVTIEVPADLEATVLAQATAKGLAVAEYVENLIRQQAGDLSPKGSLSPAERAALWLEGSKGYPSTPPLSDEAISRESMYEDRW